MKISFCFIFLFLIQSLAHAQAGEWTWMKGDSLFHQYGHYSHADYGTLQIPSPTNEPPARYSCGYWNDTAGNLWIYGGVSAPADMWMFNSQSMMWTWMSGDSSMSITDSVIAAPKGVYSASNSPGWLGYGFFTWVTPDNHLWLFGGNYKSIFYDVNNCLWQYDPTINQWAWMGVFGPTHYGIKGIGDSTTMPGVRE